MKDLVGQYVICNGELRDKEELLVDSESKLAYEVIRLIDGKPLFLVEHINRLKDSILTLGYESKLKLDEALANIYTLSEKNNLSDNNVKIISSFNKMKEEESLYIYMTKSFYPPKTYYEEGIHTILFDHKRENPNAKIIASDFRKKVQEKLDQENAFEAILVDEDGNIQEGSRSNMFFSKGGKLYTAPNESVLMGITREYILKACEASGVEVLFENLNIRDLDTIEGGFMTGTSVNILPIASINDKKLNSIKDKLYIKISEKYSDYLKEDLAKYK